MNQNKNTIQVLFISGSFDPRSKTGMGCQILLSQDKIAEMAKTGLVQSSALLKEFLQTTASRLELETTLWALEQNKTTFQSNKVLICTEFKTVNNLPDKRAKLEQTNYAGAREGTLVINADLFQKFYKAQDKLKFDVINLDLLKEDSIEKKNMRAVLNAVQKFSSENLSLDIKEKTTEKIADKWF